jgi:hypothetical protein
MRIGRVKAKAIDYAVAASIQSGKPVSADAFLPRGLRTLPPPPTAEDMAARSASLGITKTEGY